MIICLGPVCVPVWPLVVLCLMPIWNRLPEETKDQLADFWELTVYPNAIAPWFEKLPAPARKFLSYGCKKRKRRAGSGEKGDGVELTNAGASGKSSATAGEDGTTVRQRAGGKVAKDPAAAKLFSTAGPLVLTDEDHFKAAVSEAKDNGRRVFFEFTAPWCKPCQKIKPIFEGLCKEQCTKDDGNQPLYCIVDIDELDDVAMECDVVAIPAVHRYEGNAVEKLPTVSEEKLRELCKA